MPITDDAPRISHPADDGVRLLLDHPLNQHVGKVIAGVRAYETPHGDRIVIEFLGGQTADLRATASHFTDRVGGKIFCS